MKQSKLLIVGLLIFATGSLWASGGFGGFSVNYLMPDMSGLNSRLREYGYPELNEGIIGLGGQGFGMIDHLLIGGGGFGGQSVSENDQYKLSYSYGGGFFNIGYGIPIFRKVQVLGIIGIGGAGGTLKFNQITGDASFDSLLANPAREATISYNSFSVELSAGVQVFEIGSGFIHGLVKGGYIFYVTEPDWKFESGNELLGGPDAGNGFPYIGVTLLFGGREEEYD